jgi:methyl-accepting chemotaxis protein
MTKLRISLRAKLLGLVLAVVTLIGAGTVYNLGNLESSYRKRIEDQMSIDAVKLGKVLTAQLVERYTEAQSLSVNPAVVAFDKENIQINFDRYMKLKDDYDLLIVVDRNGKLVASNSVDYTGRPVQIASLQKLDFKKFSWFQNTLSGKFTKDDANNINGTVVEDFVFDELTTFAFEKARYGSSFSAQIKNVQGEVIGVFSARANSKWIEDEVSDFHTQMVDRGSTAAEVYLLNSAGKVAIHAEYRQGHHGTYIDKDEGVLLTKTANEIHDGFEFHLMQKKTGLEYLQHRSTGAEEIVAFHKIENTKSISSLGWTVVFENSADEAFANQIQLRNESYVFLLVNIFLGLLLAVWAGIVISKSISKVTQTLAMNSDEVSSASTDIASSATELSEAATEQAAALQETVSAIDEISAMVEKNASAAEKSREYSKNSRDAASKGQSTVAAMIQAIGEIDQSNEEVSRQMDDSNKQLIEITKLINDISKKTNVINEIVFQTKLLSFNASVEAARAGEYGKGFAVVAEEVGNLAQMSGGAAKEISELLTVSVEKVNSIVNSTKSRVENLMLISKEKVKTGSQTAKECDESLAEIMSQVQTVDSLVSEIAVASQEQSLGIREVSKAIGQMEQVTQQNSSVAQSSSVSAEQLRGQSEVLNSLVKDLAYIVSGSNATPLVGEVQPKAAASKKSNLRKSSFKNSAVDLEKDNLTAPTTLSTKVLNFNLKKKMNGPKPDSIKTTGSNPEKKESKYAMVSGSEFVPSADDPGFEE